MIVEEADKKLTVFLTIEVLGSEGKIVIPCEIDSLVGTMESRFKIKLKKGSYKKSDKNFVHSIHSASVDEHERIEFY